MLSYGISINGSSRESFAQCAQELIQNLDFTKMFLFKMEVQIRVVGLLVHSLILVNIGEVTEDLENKDDSGGRWGRLGGES
jgi:hypothetical protein